MQVETSARDRYSKLIRERRQLKRQWRKLTGVEKLGIDCLQVDVEKRLALLRREENMIEKRKE